MKNVEKVTEDLYVIRQEMRPGWFCSVLVFLGENNIGIIDTGYENTPEDYVFPLIHEKKRDLNEIDLIVNTHRDGDHVRGNSVFKKKTNAKIAIHSLEADAVPTATDVLESGDIVKLGDRNFKVIHTPGHRPGSICLLDKENRLLITGDSVCGQREDLIRMDKSIYIKSLRNLLKLDVDMMIMSHPFMPAEKNILKGQEINKMIKASIEVAEKL